MNLYSLAVMATTNTNVDITKGLNNVEKILLTVLSLFLIWQTIKSLMKNKGEGDLSGQAESVGTVLLALIPAALGISGIALTYGSGILDGVWSIFS